MTLGASPTTTCVASRVDRTLPALAEIAPSRPLPPVVISTWRRDMATSRAGGGTRRPPWRSLHRKNQEKVRVWDCELATPGTRAIHCHERKRVSPPCFPAVPIIAPRHHSFQPHPAPGQRGDESLQIFMPDSHAPWPLGVCRLVTPASTILIIV